MTADGRLRVLHIVGGLGLGGAQKLTALVAAGLDRERFDVTVLNLGEPGVYGHWLRASGIRVVDLGIPQHLRMSDAVRVVRALGTGMRILVTGRRWHIVHTHLFRTSMLFAIPARLAGCRLFGTVHRNYYRWQPPLELLLSPLHEAIVVDSYATGTILQASTHIRADRYVVIHNGVDVLEFDGAPDRSTARSLLQLSDSALVVAEVAHLERHKGQSYLLQAFAHTARHGELLVLVGDGPTRHSLEVQAGELGIADRVVFLGARADLAVVLAATDVLALPSEFEGFGIVQAEAMYLGKPVIGTSRGGATEVIVDQLTGFLVAYGDVVALEDRLGRLLTSPDLREAMGAAGRKRVLERFTQERMARRYADLYMRKIKTGLEAADGVL